MISTLYISIKAVCTDQKMKEKSSLLSCQNSAKGRRKRVGGFSHKTLKLAALCVLPKNELKPPFRHIMARHIFIFRWEIN